MKTCVVRRRFYSTEADNRTVTVELEPGFGTPKAAIILYTENNADTDSFDTTLQYKNFGVGFSDGTNRNVIDFRNWLVNNSYSLKTVNNYISGIKKVSMVLSDELKINKNVIIICTNFIDSGL